MQLGRLTKLQSSPYCRYEYVNMCIHGAALPWQALYPWCFLPHVNFYVPDSDQHKVVKMGKIMNVIFVRTQYCSCCFLFLEITNVTKDKEFYHVPNGYSNNTNT